MLKKYWLYSLTLPLVMTPLASIISCSSNDDDQSVNQDDEWSNRFQKFYLRKPEFSYQELDLDADLESAKWQIDLDWLWNQKLDQIFYQDRVKKNFLAIWNYDVASFDQVNIKALKIKVQFLKSTLTGKPQISPMLEFKITGFTG